jgi:hypothetical protein
MFLGLDDFGIISAYLLCFFSALACVVYGLLHWNKGAEEETSQIIEEVLWEKEQIKIDEEM